MSNATIDYRSLAVSEHLELVSDIWDSIASEIGAVAPGLSAEQRRELRRRLEAHRADPSGSIPWDEVRSQLFKNQP